MTRSTQLRAAHDALELARVTYQAAVLDAVRALVRDNVAGRIDETINLINWLTVSSPNTYDLAGEIESELASFPEGAHAAVLTMIARLRAYGAAADAIRAIRR